LLFDLFFIVHEHARHAERNIILANLPICPSICPSHIVSKQTHILSNSFQHLIGALP